MNETEPNLETKAAEVKPEAKAVEPKPQASAAEPKLDTKAAEPAPAAKAAKPKPEFRNKIIFTLSILGVLAALVAAYLFGVQRKAQPPVFKPVSNPYDSAIYANGIIESDQSSGENINIFPEVSGPITQVLAREGQPVTAGAPLFTIDDSVQRATTGQIRAQSDAALALLDELKAQPRPETLAIDQGASGSGRIQPESGPRPVRQGPRLLRHGPEIHQQDRAGHRGRRRQSGGSRPGRGPQAI